MPQVKKTSTLTIDDAVCIVEQMSPSVQQMIGLMDEWRQRDADMSTDMAMIKAALRDIQNTIYLTVRKERDDAAKAVAANAAAAAQSVQDAEVAANTERTPAANEAPGNE